MAKIFLDSQVVARIKNALQGQPAKLLLNYNDGVGPYSKVGSCSIGTDFDLLLAPAQQTLPDYNAQLSSALGPIFYKKYSARYLDSDLKLTRGSFNQIQLSGKGGLIDGSVNIIDERK